MSWNVIDPFDDIPLSLFWGTSSEGVVCSGDKMEQHAQIPHICLLLILAFSQYQFWSSEGLGTTMPLQHSASFTPGGKTKV